MIVGSISENIKIEKRVAITPDIVKKYSSWDDSDYQTRYSYFDCKKTPKFFFKWKAYYLLNPDNIDWFIYLKTGLILVTFSPQKI